DRRPRVEIQFLGAATTVTGSQFLLTTARARVLIDCGMFQGSPNEAIRNRIPLAYDPHELDAILLTHAHLDHCGLIPHVVQQGFHGPILATARPGANAAPTGEATEPDDQPPPAMFIPSEDLMMSPLRPHYDPAALRDGRARMASDPESALRQQPPMIEVDLEAPLYGEQDAIEA